MQQTNFFACPHCGALNRLPAGAAAKRLRCGKCSADLVIGAVSACTQTEFDKKVMQSRLPVLVDFWAPWCAPCRMLGPELEKLAAQFSGRLSVVKINIDDNTMLADRFHIRSVPTMLLFSGGRLVDTLSGAMPAAAISQKIQPWLA